MHRNEELLKRIVAQLLHRMCVALIHNYMEGTLHAEANIIGVYLNDSSIE